MYNNDNTLLINTLKCILGTYILQKRGFGMIRVAVLFSRMAIWTTTLKALLNCLSLCYNLSQLVFDKKRKHKHCPGPHLKGECYHGDRAQLKHGKQASRASSRQAEKEEHFRRT